MIKFWSALISCLLLSDSSLAHEMTPTYLNFSPSYIEGISNTTIHLFNRRVDSEYYEIDVYDNDWNPISFASQDKIIRIRYLEKKKIDIYIRNEDAKRVVFVCTTSKLLKADVISTGITSKICSKVKRDGM